MKTLTEQIADARQELIATLDSNINEACEKLNQLIRGYLGVNHEESNRL